MTKVKCKAEIILAFDKQVGTKDALGHLIDIERRVNVMPLFLMEDGTKVNIRLHIQEPYEAVG